MMKPRISHTSLFVAGVAIAGVTIPVQAKAVVVAGDGADLPIAPSLDRIDVRPEATVRYGVDRRAISPPISSPTPKFSPSNLEPITGNEEILIAQAIRSANDNTGTRVNQVGDQFNIEGGTQAGGNLFHSFEQLGLDANQIANFISNPNIENILGRVVGGDASIINGLLQVTGGQSSLFLINPAGIVFGPGARLNVPADFTATTATGIQIDSNWFSALGANNYEALVGTPHSFAFTTDNPGAILNAGELGVNAGQSIQLIGGTVINTGTLSSPGGDITIQAVPEAGIVTITPDGNLLSLGVPIGTQSAVNGGTEPLTALALPQLLSSGDLGHATGVTVEEGVVRLTYSDTAIPTGAGVVIASGVLDAASPNAAGGRIDVLGDRVGLAGARLVASGSSGGGIARVGGGYQGNGVIPNAESTYVSQDSTIEVDALTSGDGGQAIVWADGNTEFYGDVSAQGGAVAGNGGFVEISGHNNLTFVGNINTAAPTGTSGTLLLDPRNIRIRNGTRDGNDLGNLAEALGENSGASFTLEEIVVPVSADPPLDTDPPPPDGAFVIFLSELEGMSDTANIILQASNDIVIEDLSDSNGNPGTLTLSGDESEDVRVEFIADGNFEMLNRQDTIDARGRTLTIRASSIEAGKIEASNVNLESTNGDIIVTGILSEPGDINVASSGLFQATGEIFDAGGAFTEDVDIDQNPEILEFLRQVGEINEEGEITGRTPDLISTTSTGARVVTILTLGDLPASVLARNLDEDGLSVDEAPKITISHGGGGTTTIESGGITIQGDNRFVVGPRVNGSAQFQIGNTTGPTTLEDITDRVLISFPSDQFPADVSGSAGGILVVTGSNSGISSSIRPRAFNRDSNSNTRNLNRENNQEPQDFEAQNTSELALAQPACTDNEPGETNSGQGHDENASEECRQTSLLSISSTEDTDSGDLEVRTNESGNPQLSRNDPEQK